MKKLLALAVANGIVLIASSAQGASLLNPDNPYGIDGVGINVVDNWINNGHQASLILGSKQSGASANWEICNDLSDCEIDKFKMLQGNVLIPACVTTSDRNCVEALEFSLDGMPVQAKHIGRAADVEVLPSATYDLPKNGGVSLWEVPETSTSPAILLAVHAEIELHFNRGSKKFEQSSLAVTVVRYVVRPGKFQVPSHSSYTRPDGLVSIQTTGFDPSCVWVTENACGEMVEFPQGSIISTKLRVSNQLSGWLMGRIDQPVVEIKNLDSNFDAIKVSGKAMSIPKIFVAVPRSDGEAAMKQAFPNSYQYMNLTNFRATSPDGPRIIESFRKLAGDTAIGESLMWSFFTSPNSDPCIKKGSGFQGFVSSNASVYQGTPPAFKAGYLTYDVAGYHFQADGVTPNIGRYNLIMKSSLARCMYGFTSAPISATVSVLNNGNEQLVATQVVSEKDGWLTLEAAGFTYSEKQIKVKISQSLNATVSKFSGSNTTLTAQQKAQIKKAVSKRVKGETIVCNAPYTAAGQKALALKRAKAACDYAKTVNRTLKTFTTAVLSKNNAEVGQVFLASK